jgi:hypothetical protein
MEFGAGQLKYLRDASSFPAVKSTSSWVQTHKDRIKIPSISSCLRTRSQYAKAIRRAIGFISMKRARLVAGFAPSPYFGTDLTEAKIFICTLGLATA